MNNTTTNKNIETLNQNNLDWSLIQSQMKNKLGVEIYESWLKKINFVEEFNNYILLTVPTRFIRDWITSRYLDQILQIIKAHKKDIIRIEFKIAELKSSKKDVRRGDYQRHN
jgi:chromosomal replication initiator protein